MTRYILNSGGAHRYSEKFKAFVDDILKGLGNSPRVLYCFFARPREDWEGVYTAYSHEFASLVPETVKPVFELAFPDTFENQIKNSDVVSFSGGDDHLLLYWLKQFDVPRIWEGKVVATNSASSDALAAHFFTCDWRKCMDGLGIVPIKFIPHFESDYGAGDPRGPLDWSKAYEELKLFGDQSLPIHALHEGEYVVFET